MACGRNGFIDAMPICNQDRIHIDPTRQERRVILSQEAISSRYQELRPGKSSVCAASMRQWTGSTAAGSYQIRQKPDQMMLDSGGQDLPEEKRAVWNT